MKAPGASLGRWAQAERGLAAAMRGVCIVAFVVLLVLVATLILIRFVPIMSLGWADELVELVFAWMVFLGTAVLWRGKAHFRVDLIPNMLTGSRGGQVLEITLSLLALVFFSVFTYEGWALTMQTIVDSPILALPKALWYMVMPLSGVIIIGYIVRDLWLLSHGRRALGVDAIQDNHS